MGGLDELLAELVQLRHQLHRHPEISGEEEWTASAIKDFLDSCDPDQIHTGLGGHGLAAVFNSTNNTAGPAVMLRAELDALPLEEAAGCRWPSESSGRAHKCGHDGHMAILAGVARRLQHRRPTRGSVTLLFQPAEETGTGAAALLDDSRFMALKPDWIFALHNLPGYPLWTVLTRPGAFCAGSAGMRIRLQGATSHAAYPEQGRSPDRALTDLVTGLINLNDGHSEDLALVTVVHARLGEATFGISPGQAEIMATIRADQDPVLQGLKNTARNLAEKTARRFDLACDIDFCEEFPVTMNHPEAVDFILAAAEELDLEVDSPAESPFRWSEDFGFLTSWVPGAMFALGAGPDHAVLHGPGFDFNDDLILPGLTVLEKVARLITD